MFTLNCKGRLLFFPTPIAMGVINITPDSFYERSRIWDDEELLKSVGCMVDEGAAIIDVGGQSSRPGSERVHEQQELDRVLPAIELINESYPHVLISIDTFYPGVAREALRAGACIINDISGGSDGMLALASEFKAPFICMHMKGSVHDMHKDPSYVNVSLEVLDYFIKKTEQCKRSGIHDVIIDPGFGFSKNIQHNFTLLKEMKALQILNKPVLAGLSRKSTIYKTLGVTANEALNGTTALNMIALQNGACILRVHDVKEAIECIKMYVYAN